MLWVNLTTTSRKCKLLLCVKVLCFYVDYLNSVLNKAHVFQTSQINNISMLLANTAVYSAFSVSWFSLILFRLFTYSVLQPFLLEIYWISKSYTGSEVFTLDLVVLYLTSGSLLGGALVIAGGVDTKMRLQKLYLYT